MGTTVILNGDQIYLEELVRENARLTVQVEAERQHQRELGGKLARLKTENESLSGQAGQAAEALGREKVLGSKLDQAIKDLHFVMSGGDVCAVCENKCLMGEDCRPHWNGLDDY